MSGGGTTICGVMYRSGEVRMYRHEYYCVVDRMLLTLNRLGFYHGGFNYVVEKFVTRYGSLDDG